MQWQETLGEMKAIFAQEESLSRTIKLNVRKLKCCYIKRIFSKIHPRLLYMWTAPGGKTINPIYYSMVSQRWRSNTIKVRIYSRTDCGTNHQLLSACLKLQMKRIQQSPTPARLDLVKLQIKK